MITIKCGHCTKTHTATDAVKACSQGNLFPCHWAVKRYVGDPDEPWLTTVDCGADAIATERGWTCNAGHEHVTMETRLDEGWDYAEDADEAMDMARAGVQPFTMDGHVATSSRDFVPAYAMAGARW